MVHGKNEENHVVWMFPGNMFCLLRSCEHVGLLMLVPRIPQLSRWIIQKLRYYWCYEKGTPTWYEVSAKAPRVPQHWHLQGQPRTHQHLPPAACDHSLELPHLQKSIQGTWKHLTCFEWNEKVFFLKKMLWGSEGFMGEVMSYWCNKYMLTCKLPLSSWVSSTSRPRS